MKVCHEGVGKGYTINDNKHALFGLRWSTILAGTRDGPWILQLSSTHVNSSYLSFPFFSFIFFVSRVRARVFFPFYCSLSFSVQISTLILLLSVVLWRTRLQARKVSREFTFAGVDRATHSSSLSEFQDTRKQGEHESTRTIAKSALVSWVEIGRAHV